MRKTVFLFSGQGSQYVGMGEEIVEIFPELKKIYEIGNEILGFDLRSIINDETKKDELQKTIISQPAIFTVSILALKAAETLGIKPQAVAGHSLGEYAALVASGMISLEDGFRAIKIRSEAMEEAALKNPGGMTAVMNMPPSEIESICKNNSNETDLVTPVNYNSPVQTVIAGSINALDTVEPILKNSGAKRLIRLGVSAAFHSVYMKSAAEKAEKAFMTLEFREPNVTYYSNALGKPLDDFSDMPKYLANAITSPVRFTEELTHLKENGYENYIELGPGKVLSGLVKKTLDDVNIYNIENKASFLKLSEELKSENL